MLSPLTYTVTVYNGGIVNASGLSHTDTLLTTVTFSLATPGTLADGFVPAGTITFNLFAPADPTCTSAVYTQAVTAAATALTAPRPGFRPTPQAPGAGPPAIAATPATTRPRGYAENLKRVNRQLNHAARQLYR